MTRAEIIELIDEVIFTNNSRQVTAQKDNDLRKQVISSVFVPESDTLQGVNYTAGQTLGQKLNSIESSVQSPVLISGVSNFFNARNSPAGTSLGTNGGITFNISSRNSDECIVTTTFSSVGTSQYIPIITWEAQGTWHKNNAVLISHGQLHNNGVPIYVQRIFDSPNGRIRMALLRM